MNLPGKKPLRELLKKAGAKCLRRWWIFPLLIGLAVLLFYPAGPVFKDPASTVLYDKEGILLGAKISADQQWRFPERESVPEKFKKVVIRYEDRYFYLHPGFNPVSLIRAAFLNAKEGRIVSGGSTLTMQVIRLSRKNRERTVGEKLVEILRAFRLELNSSKEEIIGLYASHAPFGGNVVGLDAAAWRYFGVPPENLSWAEATTLAVLPNSPSLIYPGKNSTRLLEKRNQLLEKLFLSGVIDRTTYALARDEPLPLKPFPLPQFAPHLLERAVKEGHMGSRVISTLDHDLQKKTVEILSLRYPQLQANGIGNAAALVLDCSSGNVLAYAGNLDADGNDRNGKDVDIVTAPRSTGSILKPFLYAAMLNDGLILPNTLVPDIPMQIGGFIPENFTLTYDGAVPAHRALARSLNIPAVKMLQSYGYDPFCSLLRRIGMTTLTRPAGHYGLSLILGGAEATLWDLAGIYASMARTLSRYNHSGKYDPSDLHPPLYLPGEHPEKTGISVSSPVFDAASIWLTFEAMVEVARPDEEEQWQQFSSSVRIAWKTGTSFGNRDGWSIGVTPGYVVAVWTGNASGEGAPGLTGIASAAPLMFDIFKLLPSSGWFDKPYSEMATAEVCRQSGFRASPACEQKDTLWIQKKGLRTGPCPYHRMVHLDPTGNWQVTSECISPSEMIHKSWFVLPPVMEWYFRTKNPFYRQLPPYLPDCAATEPRNMEMIYPQDNSRIYVPVDLNGKPGSAIFRIAHRIPRHRVYWHLDGRFIGITTLSHQMPLSPGPGFHRLTVMDETGESINLRFEILSQGNKK